MNAREALRNLQQQQSTKYQESLKTSIERLDKISPVYKGVDEQGRHIAQKADGSKILIPQDRMITGGALKTGQSCSASVPTGSTSGFLGGMQRG